MGIHHWHIARKGESPKVVRHYNHVSKMFLFVLRNPAMFKNKMLTIYNRDKPVTDVSWNEIQEMIQAGYKERDVRTELIRKVHEEENIYKYRGAIR